MEQQTIKDRVVGVDVSRDITTYAIVDIRGNIVTESSFDTRQFPNINDYVAELCSCIVNMAESHGGYENIRSVGIGASSANYLTGCIENAPNMPWKGSIPLAAMMRDQLGLAVAVGNDAHVAALGEHAFGNAHGMRNFGVVTLGYGVGSCFFSQGQAHLGADGFAGELGHTCMDPNGRECGCGLRGCLEAYTAAKGILRTARELLEQSSEQSLMAVYGDKLTPKDITKCCEQGDALAIETFRRTGEILGWGVANYASILNPEAIIFTGGISKAGHWLFDPAYESFENHVFRNVKGKVKFLSSMLGGRERDILGASVLAWSVKEYSLFK